MDGKTQTLRSGLLNAVPIANIAIVNMKSDFKPAWIYEPGTVIIREGQAGRSPSSTTGGGSHWPVSQIPSDGRRSYALDRFSSSEIFSPDVPQTRRVSDGSMESRWLTGFTNQPAAMLFPLAHSYWQPPELKLSGADFANDGYSRDDRAYHLHRLSKGNTKLEFTIQASEKSPEVNPAFVIDGWGGGGVTMKLNGKPVAEGKDFRIGHIERLEGSSLVVWIRAQLTGPSSISLTPTSGAR
jgi:hypothetical protein